MIKIAVFASGNGSNAVNLFSYFSNHHSIQIHSIYCNNPQAGIINKSNELGIACHLFNKDEWKTGEVTKKLIKSDINFVVLAGFLWLVPLDLIKAFPNKIINIHPALLPNYGGKGMYGMNVHNQVIKDRQLESGITVHLVNEEYDKGKMLFQKRVVIAPDDTPIDLANKIHQLEYNYFPKEVEKYISSFGK